MRSDATINAGRTLRALQRPQALQASRSIDAPPPRPYAEPSARFIRFIGSLLSSFPAHHAASANTLANECQRKCNGTVTARAARSAADRYRIIAPTLEHGSCWHASLARCAASSACGRTTRKAFFAPPAAAQPAARRGAGCRSTPSGPAPSSEGRGIRMTACASAPTSIERLDAAPSMP